MMSIFCSKHVETFNKLSIKQDVERMGKERGVYRVLVGKLKRKRPLGRPRHRWWIILGWICRRGDVGIWTGLGWPMIETGGGRL
jgi:hypothetical protein